MSRAEFVNKVLALYLTADGTPSRVSRSDRLLAGSLCDQGFTVDQLETAFTLTEARRRFRDPEYPALSPIRSLHYFVPVLEEVKSTSIPDEYVRYLRYKLSRCGG